MDAEIGVRNLADPFRYNVLPSVAQALDLTEKKVEDLPDYERLAVLVRRPFLSFPPHTSCFLPY